MRIKILGAAIIAVGLGLVGCSSSSSSSSTSSSGSTGTTSTSATTTTGTTGSTTTGTTTTTTSSTTTTTTGTNGSNGSTGGSAGRIDTDCGTAHASCTPGTHCGGYTLGTRQVFACGCNFGDGGTSCAENDAPNIPASGKTVCDEATFQCRYPRDFENASLNSVPALPDGGGTLPDGGGDFSRVCDANYFPINDRSRIICLGSCSTSADCTSNAFSCLQGGLSITSTNDAGVTTVQDAGSYCSYNLCGPDLTTTNPDDGGSLPDPRGGYLVACDANGANNNGTGSGGFCIPLPNAPQSPYIGICWRNGTQADGQSCSGFFGPNTGSCVSGDLCLGTGEPPGVVIGSQTTQSTICASTCNASTTTGPQKSCPTVGGRQQTCSQFNGDPAGNPLKAGFCR